MKRWFYILLFVTVLTKVRSQGYPYPLSDLSDTEDTVVNRILNITRLMKSTVLIDTAINKLDSMLAHASLRSQHEALALTVMGYLYAGKGERDEAFLYYKKALPLVENLPDDDLAYSIVHGNYGMYMAHYHVFEIAIPHLKKAMPGLAAKNYPGEFKEDELYETIIKAYYATGQGDSAMVYQQKMVEAARLKGDQIDISQAYNDAGLYFTEAKNYEKAVEYFNKGLEILDTTRRDQLFSYVNVLESRAHPIIKKGDFDKAIKDLEYVYRVRKRQDEFHHALQALAYLVRYHMQKGLYSEAYRYVQSELNYIHSQKELNGRSAMAYLAVAELYKEMGFADKAEAYFNVYNRFLIEEMRRKGLLDEDRNRNNLNAYMTFRNKAYEQGLELERLEKERLSRDLRQTRGLIVFLILLIGMLVGLVYFIEKWRRTKRQKKLELEKKNNEILTLQNQNLEYELQLREKDLKRIATDNKIRTNLKRKFLRQLKELKNYKNNSLVKELTYLIHSLEQTIDNQDQLSLIQEKIEQINSSFENQLREEISGISAQEIKLCSLIKLGMSNQDIAKILHKEDSTIRSYKYRLKKKAGLDSVRELEQKIMDL